MKTLEPTKIIHSEGGLPYAYKTSLGWFVVGPINCMNKKGTTTRCNHLAVRDVESSKIASQHFAMEMSVKDFSLEEMFQAMHWHDFSEPELVYHIEMCWSFMWRQEFHGNCWKLRGTSKKDDHCVVPLPLCNSNLMLPNNKKQTTLTMMRLKRKIYEGQQILPSLSQIWTIS